MESELAAGGESISTDERQERSRDFIINGQRRKSKNNVNMKTSTSFRLRSPSLNSVRLRRIFDIFDKNKDSLISVEELTQALKLLGLEAEVGELESSIRSYIKPGQEGLAFDDFEALHRSLNDVFFGWADLEAEAVADLASRDESDLSEAFKVFDEDGDGYISARELQTVLEKLGLGEDGRELERVERMISCVDTNQDGLVDFFEFKDMMRNRVMVVVPFPSA